MSEIMTMFTCLMYTKAIPIIKIDFKGKIDIVRRDIEIIDLK